jgi:hypothetical protein
MVGLLQLHEHEPRENEQEQRDEGCQSRNHVSTCLTFSGSRSVLRHVTVMPDTI